MRQVEQYIMGAFKGVLWAAYMAHVKFLYGTCKLADQMSYCAFFDLELPILQFFIRSCCRYQDRRSLIST